MARITESQSSTCSVPAVERRVEAPVASKTEVTRASRALDVVRPDDRLRARARRVIWMPSTSASSISNSCAGISARLSSAITLTAWHPAACAVRRRASKSRQISSLVHPARRRGPREHRRGGAVGRAQRPVPRCRRRPRRRLAEVDLVAEVRVQQEVDGVKHAVELDAGDLQVARTRRSRSRGRRPKTHRRAATRGEVAPSASPVRSSTPISRIARISSSRGRGEGGTGGIPSTIMPPGRSWASKTTGW